MERLAINYNCGCFFDAFRNVQFTYKLKSAVCIYLCIIVIMCVCICKPFNN